MIVIDPSLPPDVQVLIKAAYHMVVKSYPSAHRISVPVREFERVRAKVKLLVVLDGSESEARHG